MMESNSPLYKVGNIVWAAMGRYPPWPSKISIPPASNKPPRGKRNYVWVYFFGSNNFAWVAENCIWPYEEFKSRFTVKLTNSLKDAIEDADEAFKKWTELETLEQEQLETLSGTSSSDESEFVFISNVGGSSSRHMPVENVNHSQDNNSESQGQKRQKRVHGSLVNSSTQSLSTQNTEPIVLCKRLPDKVLEAGTIRVNSPLDVPLGIIGMGNLGSEIAYHLLHAGCNVTIWNRTVSKCEKFTQGKNPAKVASSPRKLIQSCEIIFLCVATSASKYVFCDSMLGRDLHKKNLVVLTSLHPSASLDMEELCMKAGAQYLESPATRSGTADYDKRNLILLCAGSRSLFQVSCFYFNIMAQHAYYYGQVGIPCMLNLILNALESSVIAGCIDALALSKQTKLPEDAVTEVMLHSYIDAPQCIENAKAISQGSDPEHVRLKHLCQNLCNVMLMGFDANQPLRVFGAVHQAFLTYNNSIEKKRKV